jgi:serine/threonine protein kinase
MCIEPEEGSMLDVIIKDANPFSGGATNLYVRSFGCVIYEIFTNKIAFSADPFRIIDKILKDEPPLLKTKNPKLNMLYIRFVY